jgi:hypothetical protein
VSSVYEQIGRMVVRVVLWRFGTQLKIAAGLGAAAVAIAAYLIASREPPEG